MNDQKDELLKFIREGGKKSQLAVKRASKTVEDCQHISDLADASYKAITCTSSIDLQPHIKSWRNLNQNIDAINKDMDSTNFSLNASLCSNTASSMLVFAQPEKVAQFASPGKEEEVWAAAVGLGEVIDRFAAKDKALDLLRKFGLSTAARGEKSPVELLETAFAAYYKPVTPTNPVYTSLGHMRECIANTIATLLHRRPNQERARTHKAKILSIGKQTAHKGIKEEAISSMAERWKELWSELAGSKDKDSSRAEWRATLRKAMLFLIEFLQSLDQTKMK